MEKLIRTRDIMSQYGVCRHTIMNWVRKGKFKSVGRRGGSLEKLYDEEQVRQALAKEGILPRAREAEQV